MKETCLTMTKTFFSGTIWTIGLLRHRIMQQGSDRRACAALTFGTAADGVVPKASSTLLEVRTGRAAVSGGNGHQATPLRAANSARRCARGPRTPRPHHAVNGCWGGRETERTLGGKPEGVANIRRLNLNCLKEPQKSLFVCALAGV